MCPDIIDHDDPFIIDVFEYLDDLRISGVTNMFGAGPYLTKVFGVDRQTAGRILQEWMTSFEARHPKA